MTPAPVVVVFELEAPRDPNKFDKMFTDCGMDFLKGTAELGWTLGGGGRGGGTFRCNSSNGESSQFVVGVYRWGLGFPEPALWGGGGADLDGPADRCIWNVEENEEEIRDKGRRRGKIGHSNRS